LGSESLGFFFPAIVVGIPSDLHQQSSHLLTPDLPLPRLTSSPAPQTRVYSPALQTQRISAGNCHSPFIPTSSQPPSPPWLWPDFRDEEGTATPTLTPGKDDGQPEMIRVPERSSTINAGRGDHGLAGNMLAGKNGGHCILISHPNNPLIS